MNLNQDKAAKPQTVQEYGKARQRSPGLKRVHDKLEIGRQTGLPKAAKLTRFACCLARQAPAPSARASNQHKTGYLKKFPLRRTLLRLVCLVEAIFR
ncbi:hypothetical protein [Eikenella longinqua]|uniref:hypothetical protein n=1 Tax=Eikenella TaxID=538 RepID=UPI000AA5A327